MSFSVCLISLELFHWGKYGGIGKATRDIGRELSDRGVDVSAVVPRGENQEYIEELDGIKVYSHPIHLYPLSGWIFRRINADIYHSQEPSWGTKIAMDELKYKAHVATCQNPKTETDWNMVSDFYTTRRRVYNKIIQPLVNSSMKNADAVFCQAKYTIPKARALYDLDYAPAFLPNPVRVPVNKPRKAEVPTVCFLGRLDEEKNPEGFINLASRFPEIHFIMMGKAHDQHRDEYLREKYGDIPNLEFTGFITGKEKDMVLEKSWILINTSVSECLPVSFIEAAAHRCAILSPHDPDGFATGFGYHVSLSGLDSGLTWLLGDEHWKTQGEKGYRYVSEVHETKRVIDLHLQHYVEILEKKR
ncbi:MAG: glycosyltransferase family 4 protein [Candidatus Bathyarchaeota archaeon]|nr:glycosyltransferase family 4 protein [Candidatus Bathyarchaeota archaeon]